MFKKPIGDGLPETLGQWIAYSGIDHIKIKLNGDDLHWDVNRVTSIHAVTNETQAKRGVKDWYYSLDFNERCRNVGVSFGFHPQSEGEKPQCILAHSIH